MTDYTDLQILARLIIQKLTPNDISSQKWQSLIELAMGHRILPMLWAAIEDELELLPDKSTHYFRKQSIADKGLGFIRKTVMLEVHRTFIDNDIDAIWLKGAALAYQYYPDFWLRYMKDIDVWVRKDQIDDAMDCLIARGFDVKLKKEPIDFDPYTTQIHHQIYRRGIRVEIHFRLTPPYEDFFITDEQHQWFWETAKSIPSDVGNLKILSLPSQILHLVHHDVAHHEWNKSPQERDIRLQRKLDLHRIIQHHDIDWQVIISKAEELGLVYVLNHAIKSNIFYFGAEAYKDYPSNLYENLTPHPVVNYQNEYTERFVQLFKNMSFKIRLQMLRQIIIPKPSEMRHFYDIETQADLIRCYLITHPRTGLTEVFTVLKRRLST